MYINAQTNQPIYRNHSKLLISESPLQVLPTLAVKIGLNEALMLQQVHYWISNPMNKNIRNGRVWVYKTYAEWQQEFPFWSLITIKRISYALERMGLLLSTSNFNKLITDRTKWYTIDYDKLYSLEIGASYQTDTVDVSDRDDGRIKLIRSIPETTTEITRKNNNESNNVVRLSELEKRSLEVMPTSELKQPPKPEPSTSQLEPNGSVVVDYDLNDLMKMIRGWAISRVLLENFVKKHGVWYVLQKIKLTKSAITLNRVKNPGAYLNKAISLDWMPPAPKEDEEALNKAVETIFPTHEENIAWYNLLPLEAKKQCFKHALTKHAHFDKLLESNGLDFLSDKFTETTWFTMLMELVGRARR